MDKEQMKENNRFNKKKIGKYIARIILIILIIINCFVIFRFSSEESEQSNQTSGKVVDNIVEKSPKTKNLSKKEKEKKKEEIVTPVRKAAHFSIYTCLGALLYLLCRTFKGKNWKRILISIGLAFTYACTDEMHQRFVGGRSGEFKDVCIDSCGAIFGIAIVFIICTIINKIIKNHKSKSENKSDKV